MNWKDGQQNVAPDDEKPSHVERNRRWDGGLFNDEF
jgi:hypothetical protein